MANNIDLTISAPNQLFELLRCSGRLIFRLRTESAFQAAPVFRMAYSAPTAHRAVSSETLMLQVRFAHPPNCAPPYRFFVLFRSAYFPSAHRPPVSSPLAAAAALWLPCVRGAVRRRAGLRGCLRVRGKGKGRRPSPVSAPNRLFELLRCFARLIRQAETHDLQPHSRPPSKHTVLFLPKRSCFRFASLSLRTPHRPPVSSPLAAAAALWLPCVRGAVRRSGLRGCPLGVGGKGEGSQALPQSPLARRPHSKTAQNKTG